MSSYYPLAQHSLLIPRRLGQSHKAGCGPPRCGTSLVNSKGRRSHHQALALPCFCDNDVALCIRIQGTRQPATELCGQPFPTILPGPSLSRLPRAATLWRGFWTSVCLSRQAGLRRSTCCKPWNYPASEPLPRTELKGWYSGVWRQVEFSSRAASHAVLAFNPFALWRFSSACCAVRLQPMEPPPAGSGHVDPSV